MTHVNDPPLEERLCFALYSAAMAMNRAYKPLLDRLGITYPQYLVLEALSEEKGRTIGSIADRLSLEPSTISPLVKRLATAGLVRRDRDPDNERHVQVVLTEKGRSLRQKALQVADAVVAQTGLSGARMRELTTEVQDVKKILTER